MDHAEETAPTVALPRGAAPGSSAFARPSAASPPRIHAVSTVTSPTSEAPPSETASLAGREDSADHRPSEMQLVAMRVVTSRSLNSFALSYTMPSMGGDVGDWGAVVPSSGSPASPQDDLRVDGDFETAGIADLLTAAPKNVQVGDLPARRSTCPVPCHLALPPSCRCSPRSSPTAGRRWRGGRWNGCGERWCG
jgi:hypothetical protein